MGLGYDKIRMTPSSRSITNLVNVTSTQGTFGKGDTTITRLLKVALAVVIYIVIEALFFRLFPWYLGILLWILGLYPLLRGISIFVFNEKAVKRDYMLRQRDEMELDPMTLWGIYDIAEKRPYTMFYMDGQVGLAYLAIRSSSVGDGDRKLYKHYNAITEMLNLAKPWGISIFTPDIQSTEVRDTRLNELYENLNYVSDSVLESVLADVYKHLDDCSYNSRLSYEFYIFRAKCSEQVLYENVMLLLDALNKGNYRGFKNLNKQEIQELLWNLYGLEGLEVKDMIDEAALRSNAKSVRVLWVGNEEGKRKVINDPVSGVVPVKEDVTLEVKKEVEVEEVAKGSDELLDLFTGEIGSKQETFTQVLRETDTVLGDKGTSEMQGVKKDRAKKDKSKKNKAKTVEKEEIDLF